MWGYRRMMKISWHERVTNEEILRRVKEKSSFWKIKKKRKLNMLGHTLRHDDNNNRLFTGRYHQAGLLP